MIKLEQLIAYLDLPAGDFGEIAITGVTLTSGEVRPGDLFIALSGQRRHGAEFIPQAIANGAVAVLIDDNFEIVSGAFTVPIIMAGSSAHIRANLGDLAALIYRHPFDSLLAVGITGTNGKTTTATLLAQIWRECGRRVGQVGTTGIWVDQEYFPATLTTPEASSIQRYARAMVERKVTHFVGEASSHAMMLARLRGAHFQIVAFTNLTQDHLDFHGDMQSYFLAKAKLFTPEYGDLGLINIDDEWGVKLVDQASIPVLTLAFENSSAHWHFTQIDYPSSPQKWTSLAIRGSGGVLIQGRTLLAGRHNLYNLLMAVALAVESGADPLAVANAIEFLLPPPGRMEEVVNNYGFRAFVDFAHSPDSVENILQVGRELASKTSGRVIAILGCGGDRDVGKRPIMGQLLAKYSDIAIMTSDNPRSEQPARILEQMQGELELGDNLISELDRRSAIALAVASADVGDVILLLGKGHETGQEIAGQKFDFDDRIELAAAIAELADLARSPGGQ